MKNAPKATIEGPQGSAEKAKDALKVAETMDKLSLMMGKIDDKIKFYEKKVVKHEKWRQYPKKYQNGVKANLKWEKGELLKYKILKQRMEKVSEQLNKIEAERDGSYSKVAIKTLDDINKTMDKQAKIWRFDLRQDIIGSLRKRAFSQLGETRMNLACIKDVFVMMRDGEKTRYKGFRLSKKGNKIALEYKGTKKEFTLSVKGKNLEWEIKDEKGEKISAKKATSNALTGLFTGKDEAQLSKDNKYYYYKPESAVKTYANYRVKDKIKVAAKPAPKIEEAKRKAQKAPKVVGKYKPKPILKKKAAKTPKAPTEPGTSEATGKVMKKFVEKKAEVKESKATITETNKWGDNLARDLGIFTNTLLSRITVFKMWTQEGKTMKQYQAFKREMQEVGKEVKKADSVDKIVAANKLATVYKKHLSSLPSKLQDKLKVKITDAPQNNAQIALNKSVFPVGPKGRPKVMVAAKETKERAPGLNSWASENDKTLKNIRQEFIKKNSIALTKMYGEHAKDVLMRLNFLNRALKNPKITFTEAVKVCKSLRRGFRDLQKRAKEKKIAYVDQSVKKNISDMTTLKFPPEPKNPTLAEQKLIKAENKRVAGIKEFTKDIAV